MQFIMSYAYVSKLNGTKISLTKIQFDLTLKLVWLTFNNKTKEGKVEGKFSTLKLQATL